MKNRKGSYKKILLSPDFLVSQLPYLQLNAQALFAADLTDTELCSLYILLFLRVRHQKNWLQKNSFTQNFIMDDGSRLVLEKIPHSFNLNEWEKQKLSGVTFLALFSHFNLKGIPQSVNRTMINWIQRQWKIKLLTHIPSPRELLQMQVVNCRCVSLIKDDQELGSLVLSARDPLSFVLHDLMHADHFFNQQDSLRGQLGFYRKIESVYDQQELISQLKKDKQFKKEFEYVASDMNAYVIHLFKCLKSAFVKSDTTQTLFIKLLHWWKLDESQLKAALRLNTPEFSDADESLLRHFFEHEVTA